MAMIPRDHRACLLAQGLLAQGLLAQGLLAQGLLASSQHVRQQTVMVRRWCIGTDTRASATLTTLTAMAVVVPVVRVVVLVVVLVMVTAPQPHTVAPPGRAVQALVALLRLPRLATVPCSRVTARYRESGLALAATATAMATATVRVEALCILLTQRRRRPRHHGSFRTTPARIDASLLWTSTEATATTPLLRVVCRAADLERIARPWVPIR
jgi:hypothetical protein